MQDGSEPRSGDGTAPSTWWPGPFRPAPVRAPSGDIPICPFLAREGPDLALGTAIGAVDPAHRCVALVDPVPQSARQQELVCLTGAHVNCPRYLRGLLLAGTPAKPPAREPLSSAVILAALVLVAAIAASFGFLAVRGGFELEVDAAGGSQLAVAPTVSSSPRPATSSPSGAETSGAASPPASAASAGAGAPSTEPTPAPTPGPTPASTLEPAPGATPAATPVPKPSSDRYAVLTACPSTPNCWVYVIRSGDNLVSIANWFGVSYTRMRAMNPSLRIPIHAGDRLRIPTPTR